MSRRHPRARPERGPSVVGTLHEVEIGSIAHGGFCVARLPEGPVVFVRHTLPGERVRIEITEGAEGDRFWRADAIEVLEASPARVAPPCQYAGICGGCDFQHVALVEQRTLKAQVIREQFARLAGLEVDIEVAAVPGDDAGLRWRERIGWVSIGDERGLRMHRSHQIVVVDECLLERPVEGEPVGNALVKTVTVGAVSRLFSVDPDGFWQQHPGAPATLVDAVLRAASLQPGESVLDLYAGVGLFASFAADVVGPGARLVAVEGEGGHAQLAGRHLKSVHQGARVLHEDVLTALREGLDEPFDVVILDPPRSGAKREVMEQIVDRAPRAIVYVACDPAALARDTAYAAELGYGLTSIEAFDLFPMTHHVECVALLART